MSINKYLSKFKKKGFLVLGIVRNLNNEYYSNIFTVFGDRTLDASFSAYCNAEEILSIPIEISFGGTAIYNKVIENFIKYKKFNFKEEWINDEKKNSKNLNLKEMEKLYIEEFGPFEYSLLVSRYSFLFSADLDAILKYSFQENK